MTKWFVVIFLLAAIGFSAADYANYYDKLPPSVAAHFDIHGAADAWITKDKFAGLAALTFAIAIAVEVPLLLAFLVIPSRLIHLPNKDYWLAPERERETRVAIVWWSLWFFAATFWFLALLFHEMILANLRQPPTLQGVWWLLAGYLAFVVVLVFQLFTRFLRKPDPDFLRRPEDSGL